MRSPPARFWLPLLLLAGCQDYELNAKASDTDSKVGDPTQDDRACSELTPDPPADPEVDQTCVNDALLWDYEAQVEWRWDSNPEDEEYNQVMATPAVGPLTDDNGDGAIDENDVPDVVFTAFRKGAYSSAGMLVAVTGDTGRTIWTTSFPGGYSIFGSGGVAIGDLEGDGKPEVCVAGVSASVICLSHKGTFKWAAGDESCFAGAPAIADLDGDGRSEVIFGREVFDASGDKIATGTGGTGGHCLSVPVDVDDDGILEVLAGNTLYDHNMETIWDDGLPDGVPAVGDFDSDVFPEFVRAAEDLLILTDTDGSVIWTAEIPGGGGGAPTIADYDGDLEPEVGLASLAAYTVFDTNGTVLWSNPTQDISSASTGSAVFDFDDDGAAEVVYADEDVLYIYDGASGAENMALSGHASATLYEYPLIVDVDGDGSTEIVVPSNDHYFEGWTGITVLGETTDAWAPSRRIWNQFAYHITNVNEDGSIPTRQDANWVRWNTFRAAGTEVGPGHWMVDLKLEAPEVCTTECDDGTAWVWLPVTNAGTMHSKAPVVRVVDNSGAEPLIVLDATLPRLESGGAALAGPVALTQAQWPATGLTATVVDGYELLECDDADNVVELGPWPCD